MVEDKSWVVLLAKPEWRDPLDIAKALAAARKTPLQDQMMSAKGAWGIIAEHVTETGASELVEALGKAGVPCLSCPTSSLNSLPAAEIAKNWQDLQQGTPVLIAVTGLTITSTTIKTIKEGPSGAQKVLNTAILLGTGLPIKFGGKERTVEKTTESADRVFSMDVFYADLPRRLRLEAEHFDYSYLKERKQYQVFANFKGVVGDLVKAAPSAWINHGTKILLDGKPIATMGYASLADLERECRWLLTLQKVPGT